MNNKGFKFLLVSIFSLGIINCSGGGSDSSSEQEPVNQKPTANAGADQSVDEQTAVTVEGSGTDSDGSIASYAWTQTSGPQISLGNTSQQNLEFTAPVAKQATSLEFTLTVTDNDGASGSDSVTVTVNPVDEQKVTLQGVVTDGPIANAAVTAEVAGRTYSTTADASGNYTLEIGADEDENLSELLVVLTADGVDEQLHVKLKSLVDSFGSILEQAGNDNILTADENNGVNVTHFSTAILGLLVIEKGENYLTNSSSFEAGLPTLSGIGVWEIATATKLIIDYSDQYPELGLPEGVENSWEFASNKNAINEYLSDIPDHHDALYNEIKNSTYDQAPLFEPSIITPQKYIEVNNKFMTTTQFNFEESGGGRMNYSAVEQSLSVNNAVDKLQLSLEGKVVSTGSIFKDYMGTEYQVYRDEIWENIEVKVIKSTELADLVALKIDGRYQFDTSPFYDFEDELFSKYDVKLFIKKTLPITNDDLLGVRMLPTLAPSLDPDEDLDTPYGTFPKIVSTEAVVIEFFENGTAESISGNFGNGSWNITSEGSLALYLENANLKVRKVSTNLWAVEAYDAFGTSLGFAAGMSALKDGTLLDEEGAVGVYAVDGLISDTSSTYYWFEVQEGGVGYQFGGNDSNNNGILETSEYSRNQFFWEIVDGKLQLNIYRNISNQVCTVITSDCFVYMRRTFDMFEKLQGKQYVTYQYQVNMLPSIYGDLSPELQALWVYDMIYARYLIKSSGRPIPTEVQ
ncbi:PKD domain-containing protein [Kangiella koreensis]|uniref:PKD/Chitinase domain-containing protein n=1 Tax=Kangiella koreensis (strain DSM 16069 / JCM 12317 / KCTC 12182 / SW-125) TaxID=523791 RepID=C7R9B1_KANKD|nr:hypothetical protein [Kangiella koreensis]ACV27901.1 hypothetical protein Kkor_2492 [Kangiella koreensis DSM 16069]